MQALYRDVEEVKAAIRNIVGGVMPDADDNTVLGEKHEEIGWRLNFACLTSRLCQSSTLADALRAAEDRWPRL